MIGAGDEEETVRVGTARARERRPGVLRLRIEPPEAARALAGYASSAYDFFYRSAEAGPTPTPRDDKAGRQRDKTPQTAATARETIPLRAEDVAQLAEQTRDSLRQNLVSELEPRQMDKLANRVYTLIERRLAAERNRMGWR